MRVKNQIEPYIRTIFLVAFLFSRDFMFCSYSQNPDKEYTYKHYTIHDGLAQMQVMSLFQDSKGYLWGVTKAGLSRFDGYRFKNYPGEIIPGFDIAVMGESSDGRIILFGPESYSVLTGDSIHLQDYPAHSYSGSSLAHSHRYKQKALYRPPLAGNIISFVMDYSNPDSLFVYEMDQNLGTILFLEEDEHNYVWQSKKDTLYISDVKSGRLIRKIYNQFQVTRLIQHGSKFIGINDGREIYVMDDLAFRFLFKIEESLRYLKIISTPGHDALIVKTDKSLFYYKEKLIPVKLNMTQIRDLLFDMEDNLWVSTEEGLYNFFQLNFVNFTFNMGNKDWVWSVLEDDDHTFWFASYQNGLWKWDGTRITDFTGTLNNQLAVHLKQKPLPEQYRYYMGASKLGSTLFFPTECNVLQYKNGRFSPVGGLPELPFQMTKANDGNLYFSGYPGLFKISKNGNVKSWHRDSLQVSSVLNFEHDKYGNMVVIGQNGMSVIRGDSIDHFNNQQLLHSYSLAKDYHKNVWIAGIQNINLFTGDSLIHVDTREEEAFYSMLFVKPHYLFLGGIKGLYIANLDEFYRNGNFETVLYNQSNGFTGIECGQNGFFTDSEGMVWIPTSDLVTRFDPQKLIYKKINPPRIYLRTSSSADNIRWQEEQTSGIKSLKHHRNNLRFTVDAVSFANSGNIRYYYRLNGLQDEWPEATENNEVTYYNLRPGNYEFEVKADAGISQATSETLHTTFIIETPFWLKWWFIITGLILLHAIILSMIYLARKREKQKAAIQQRLTQLRSEALSAQLDPHFVMNCLNNISGLVNAGYKQQANDYIVRFSKLLRVILQNVKKESIPLSGEIEMVQKYMELEQFRCNNCFSFEIKLPRNYSTEKIMVPPMILQPLVENSVKHGFGGEKIKNARIDISLKVEEKHLYISIADNGRGMKVQSDPLGTGLGTKITRERIELLQKKENVQFEITDKNPGTEVHFRIPLVIRADET